MGIDHMILHAKLHIMILMILTSFNRTLISIKCDFVNERVFGMFSICCCHFLQSEIFPCHIFHLCKSIGHPNTQWHYTSKTSSTLASHVNILVWFIYFSLFLTQFMLSLFKHTTIFFHCCCRRSWCLFCLLKCTRITISL